MHLNRGMYKEFGRLHRSCEEVERIFTMYNLDLMPSRRERICEICNEYRIATEMARGKERR